MSNGWSADVIFQMRNLETPQMSFLASVEQAANRFQSNTIFDFVDHADHVSQHKDFRLSVGCPLCEILRQEIK